MGGRAWTQPERDILSAHAHKGWQFVQAMLRECLRSERTKNAIRCEEKALEIQRPRCRSWRENGLCRASSVLRLSRRVVTRTLPLMGHAPTLPGGETRRVDPYCVQTFLRDERTKTLRLSDFSLVRSQDDRWATRMFRHALIDVREPGVKNTQPRVPLALCEAVEKGATWRHPMARAWRVALLHNDTTMAPWAAWVAATSPTDPPWMADATADARRFVEALRSKYARWVDEG